jgi:hypothetical protein
MHLFIFVLMLFSAVPGKTDTVLIKSTHEEISKRVKKHTAVSYTFHIVFI